MKTTILAFAVTAVLAAIAIKSSGQIEVSFLNPDARVTYGSGTDAGQPVFGPAGVYEYSLFMGALGATEISQMQPIDTVLSLAAASSTTIFAGLIPANPFALPGNVANTLNFQSGTTYSFLVAGWTSADGNTYAQALASGDLSGWAGLSTIGFMTVYNSPSPAAEPFGVLPGQIGGFSLAPIPEPSTMGLSTLGTAVLWLFRRRKQGAAASAGQWK